MTIRTEFNKYMETAPQKLKDLFDKLDEDNAIMLQTCFETFGNQIKNLPKIPICPKANLCSNRPGGAICPKEEVICPL